MAGRAIPIIAFHGVESIYMFVSLMRVCVVYVVKLRDSEGLSQLMGMARNRTCA